MSEILPILEEEKPMSHLSAGKGFIQLKADFLWPYMAEIADCPSAMRLWWWLLAHCNRANCVLDASQQRLMDGASLSRRSVYQALSVLEEHRLIVREGKAIWMNELVTWKGYKPVNPYFAKAMAQPVSLGKRVAKPRQKIATKKIAAA